MNYVDAPAAKPIARAPTAPSVSYVRRSTPAQWDLLAAQFQAHGQHMLDKCPPGRVQVAPWHRASQRAETLKSVCGEWHVTSLYEDQLGTLAPALPFLLAPPASRGALGLPPAGPGYAGRRDCYLRTDGKWEARAICLTHSLTMTIVVCHAIPSGLADAFRDWLWAAAALSGLQGMVQGIDVCPSASITRYSVCFADAATAEQRGVTGDAIWRRVFNPGGGAPPAARHIQAPSALRPARRVPTRGFQNEGRGRVGNRALPCAPPPLPCLLPCQGDPRRARGGRNTRPSSAAHDRRRNLRHHGRRTAH